MNFITQDILASYSLPTIIIAIIVLVVSLTLSKFFNKLPKLAKVYFPFFLATLLYFAYDMIFVIEAFTFRTETLYAGVVSGSLSAIICSWIKRIKQGNVTSASSTLVLIEGILQDYLDKSILTKTAYEIENLISLGSDDTSNEKGIIDTLTSVASNISTIDICHLAKLIIVAVNSIKKT